MDASTPSTERVDALVWLYMLYKFPNVSPSREQLNDAFFEEMKNSISSAAAKISHIPQNVSLAQFWEAALLPESENSQDNTKQLSKEEIDELAHTAFTENKDLDTLAENPRSITGTSDFMTYLLPGNLPEPPGDRKTLAELYFTMQTLPTSRLLSGSHKTLTTDKYKQSLLEGKLAIIYNRVAELERNNLWSFRQKAKFTDPKKTKVHQDHFMDEMRWMGTNFREERKWKIALCYEISVAVLEFWEDGGFESKDRILPKQHIIPVHENEMTLVACPSELDGLNKLIFDSLEMDQVFNFSKITSDHLEDLPYIPVSRFLISNKLGREWQNVVFERPAKIPELLAESAAEPRIPASQLFHNKHSSTEVRAPKPPDHRYMNYRLVTIWLPQDDQNLQQLALKLGYNWDLVSSYLSPQDQYIADIERRTPWQCFERWLQLNPTFDIKDLSGRYAAQAKVWLESSNKTQVATKRRLAPVGVAADNLQRGHKRLRWSSMFDAIRKVKRKRESQPKGNPMRRQTVIDGNQTLNMRQGIPTAQELSRIKFERDKAAAEAYAQEQRSMIGGQTSRFKSQARQAASQPQPAQTTQTNSQSSNNQMTTSIAGLPVPSSVAAAAAANAANPMFSQDQLQQFFNERRRVAQAQTAVQVNRGVGAATPISQQQQQQQQQKQQQYYGYGSQQNSPQLANKTLSTGSPIGSPVNRPGSAMGQAGMNSASVAAAAAGRIPRPPPLSREQVTSLMNKIAMKHPNLTKEQVQQLATQEIQLYLQKRNAAVRNKAAQAQQQAQAQAQAQAQTQAQAQGIPSRVPTPQSSTGSPAPQNFMR